MGLNFTSFFFTDKPCECGIANTKTEVAGDDIVTQKIINGVEAKPNEFPWQVALVKSGLHTPICGGTIISEKHILTAAHCTSDIELIEDVEALVGEHDLLTSNDEAKRMKISRIIEHPNYNPKTVAYDFSLLVLAEAISFSK